MKVRKFYANISFTWNELDDLGMVKKSYISNKNCCDHCGFLYTRQEEHSILPFLAHSY